MRLLKETLETRLAENRDARERGLSGTGWDELIDAHLNRQAAERGLARHSLEAYATRPARLSRILRTARRRAGESRRDAYHGLPRRPGRAIRGRQPAASSGEYPRPGARDGRSQDYRARPRALGQAAAASAHAAAHADAPRCRDADRGDRHLDAARDARPRDARARVRMRAARFGAGRICNSHR